MNPTPANNGEIKKRGRSRSDSMNLGPKEAKLKVTPKVPALSELTDVQIRELAEKRNLIWTASRQVLESRYNDFLKLKPEADAMVKMLYDSRFPWKAGVFVPKSKKTEEQEQEFREFCIDFVESQGKVIRWNKAKEVVTLADLLELPEEAEDREEK